MGNGVGIVQNAEGLDTSSRCHTLVENVAIGWEVFSEEKGDENTTQSCPEASIQSDRGLLNAIADSKVLLQLSHNIPHYTTLYYYTALYTIPHYTHYTTLYHTIPHYTTLYTIPHYTLYHTIHYTTLYYYRFEGLVAAIHEKGFTAS